MTRHLCWCVVVGCCVRTFGTRCLVFGDTLFLIMDLQVCVCVCVCDFCGTGVFQFGVFPRFPRIPFKCVCVCVCVFFPRASLFSTFLRTLARSSRAYLLVIVFSWLAVHFPVLRRVGSACAGSAPRPLLCGWLPCALV